MTPVPTLTDPDVVFGSIKHMPAYEAVPDTFKDSHDPYVRFICTWFFDGLKEADFARLHAREGVDRAAALRAIKAILASFAPKHEHKEAGAAYLLSEWFELR